MDNLPPELVETILCFLPAKDLLFVQRVGTHWRHIIKTSPRLQAALFYTPAGQHRFIRWTCSCPDGVEVHHYEILPAPDDEKRSIAQYFEDDDGLGFVYTLPLSRLNPILFHHPTPKNIFAAMTQQSTKLRIKPMTFRHISAASCRKMYLCQPPIRGAYYTWRCDHMEIVIPSQNRTEEHIRGFCVEGEIQNEHGLTMGDILDEMTAKGSGQNPSTPFTLTFTHAILATEQQEQHLRTHPQNDGVDFDWDSLCQSVSMADHLRPEYYRSVEQLKQAMASCRLCAIDDDQNGQGRRRLSL
ncbi:uncharacterized protein RHO25_006615 [Cercospora beticola]|uniref:F-box domain-containing protein n=1 Tax=Cercospora beticola TaxID=122368 RepID=A0ABZ0NR13_CERBT|nr:hypothetical protein RHO25_006615 [Cercospora beticola]